MTEKTPCVYCMMLSHGGWIIGTVVPHDNRPVLGSHLVKMPFSASYVQLEQPKRDAEGNFIYGPDRKPIIEDKIEYRLTPFVPNQRPVDMWVDVKASYPAHEEELNGYNFMVQKAEEGLAKAAPSSPEESPTPAGGAGNGVHHGEDQPKADLTQRGRPDQEV